VAQEQRQRDAGQTAAGIRRHTLHWLAGSPAMAIALADM